MLRPQISRYQAEAVSQTPRTPAKGVDTFLRRQEAANHSREERLRAEARDIADDWKRKTTIPQEFKLSWKLAGVRTQKVHTCPIARCGIEGQKGESADTDTDAEGRDGTNQRVRVRGLWKPGRKRLWQGQTGAAPVPSQTKNMKCDCIFPVFRSSIRVV